MGQLILLSEYEHRVGDILAISIPLPFGRISSFFGIKRRVDFICTKIDSQYGNEIAPYRTTVVDYQYVYIWRGKKIWTKILI